MTKHKRFLKPFLVGVLFLTSIPFLTWWLLRERPLNAEVHVGELTIGGSVRTYRKVVPSNFASPVPVVFAFHGIGDSADSMAEYSQLDRLAADSGFILVYPSALNSMWSTINIDPAKLDANPDVQFFDALYARIASEHDIGADRIYLAGMSNGASFVHVLAAARPNTIAALVAHSGLRPEDLGECENAIPMILLTGADDSVAPIMESNVELYRKAGCQIEFIRVPRLGHEWSTQHNKEIWRFLVNHANSQREIEGNRNRD